MIQSQNTNKNLTLINYRGVEITLYQHTTYT